MKEKKPVIEVKNLTIGYEDYIILEKINFTIFEGEIFFIVGASGCGKTTVLKHLIGLYPPLAGEILINGVSMVNASEAEKDRLCRQFGVMYQTGALFSSLTLEENIALPLKEFAGLDEELISAIAKLKLSLVGLEGFEHFTPAELSGGMKKRAGLARALAMGPKILFFDEPSAGLDPISSAALDRLIMELRDNLGTTMVIVSHELDSIYSVADRIIVLDKESKSIIEKGDPRRLRDGSRNPWVREFLTRSSMRG